MSEYSLRELECFLTVAGELSFTRAAERLRLAQPPLSRHIQNLEEKLGVLLFERSRRNVALTPAGLAFREEAKDILPRLQRAGEAARRASPGETDRLAVGFVSAVLSPELVAVFTGFRKRYPKIRLQLHDLLPSDQLAALGRNELDIAFIGVAPEKLSVGIAAIPWREEVLFAFVPPDHEFSVRKEIRLADLAGEPFVMISPEAAPAYSSHLHRLCLSAGFRPRVVEEASRAQAVAALTVAGAGVSILPASLHRVTGNGISLVSKGRKKTSITHSVAHRSNPSATAANFLEILSDSKLARPV
ncbi:MAG TPA: LysR substrate-binding domain-containing protein [Verrucomicrobiales bacterium]|nr:LysR substrate-binding domain-containing protein [Verrucomicrobiales bacterium]